MNLEVPVIPDCDKILTKIRTSNAERQRRYLERGGKNQRRPHDHRDDVIKELREKVLDLREEIQDLKIEIRELKLNQRVDSDNDTDSEAEDDVPPPQHDVPPPSQHDVPPPPPPHDVPPPPPHELVPHHEIEVEQEEVEEEQEQENIAFEIIHPEKEPENVAFEENPLHQQVEEEEEEEDEEEDVGGDCNCQSNVTIFTLPYIIQELKKQTDITAGTLDTTIRGITSFFRIVECDNIPACLVAFENVKSKLDLSTQAHKNNLVYSTNSKKTYIQSVLICITRLKIPIDKVILDKYLRYFDILKMQSVKEAEDTRKSPKHAVISYDNYLRKIKTKFGEASKQYLIAMMYSECTCRDNYGGMTIVETLDASNDDDINYLVININHAYIVLHKFKTSKKYGTIQVELSDTLTTLLKNYINKHKLTDTLFPENAKNGLSVYISAMNKKVGVEGGGINPLRHMMVETILSNNDVSLDERANLATKMGHSPAVQTEYRRILDEYQSQNQVSQDNEESKTEDEQREEKDGEDEEENLIRQAIIRHDANEALERENDIRRENMRLERIERERIERESNHEDQPQAKKQKKTKRQGVKRKETDDVDDTNTKKQMTTRSQKRKKMDNTESPPTKIARKVTIN